MAWKYIYEGQLLKLSSIKPSHVIKAGGFFAPRLICFKCIGLVSITNTTLTASNNRGGVSGLTGSYEAQ